MKYTPILILVGLWLEATNFLLSRYAVRVNEWQLHPKFRFIQYGIREIRWRSQPIPHEVCERFFIMKLPSWQWMSIDFGRRFGWCQICLIWDSRQGWHTWWQPEDRP